MVTNSRPLHERTAAIDARFLKEERIGRAPTLTRFCRQSGAERLLGQGWGRTRRRSVLIKPLHRGLLWRGAATFEDCRLKGAPNQCILGGEVPPPHALPNGWGMYSEGVCFLCFHLVCIVGLSGLKIWHVTICQSCLASLASKQLRTYLKRPCLRSSMQLRVF